VTAVFHPDAASGQTVRRQPEARSVLADVADGTITVPDLLEARTLGAQYPGLPEFAEEFNAAGANLIPLELTPHNGMSASRFHPG
jgi:hypothetical protein